MHHDYNKHLDHFLFLPHLMIPITLSSLAHTHVHTHIHTHTHTQPICKRWHLSARHAAHNVWHPRQGTSRTLASDFPLFKPHKGQPPSFPELSLLLLPT